MRLPAAYLTVTLAAVGCASIEVHGVATANGPSVFELRGEKIEQLQVEATRLCPHGHDVLRQWQRYQAGGSDNAALQWFSGATQRVSGREENLALMTVQCRA